LLFLFRFSRFYSFSVTFGVGSAIWRSFSRFGAFSFVTSLWVFVIRFAFQKAKSGHKNNQQTSIRSR